LAFLLLYYLGLFSQSIHEKISSTFDFECTTGSPIGARIGIEEVLHVGTGWVALEIAGNQFFRAYKNGVLMMDGYVEYYIGDNIIIRPYLSGLTSIAVYSDETGCQINT